jgi:hypothetical protein
MTNEYGDGKNLRLLAELLEANRDIPMTAVHCMFTETIPYEECYNA